MAKKKTVQKSSKATATATEGSPVPGDYPQLLSAIKSRIQTARVQAHLAVNRELVSLYWDLGKLIVERQEIEGWGKAVIERLSTDLCATFPEMTGLSISNLWNCRKFYLVHGERVINLQQAVGDLNEPVSAAGLNLQQPVGELQDPPANLTEPVLAQPVRETLRQPVAESDLEKCPEPLLGIPWGHNLKLIEKLNKVVVA